MSRHLVLIALALLVPAACLADKAVEMPLVGQTLDAFEREAATVRAGLQPGGVYEFMKDADRQRVAKRLDDMRQLLQAHAGQVELSKDDRVALVNAQEEVNALLLHNDSNRLICERGAHTGSRIRVTTCQTYGEMMQREERDRRTLGDIQRQPQTQRDGQ
jgi:hypothetical protein